MIQTIEIIAMVLGLIQGVLIMFNKRSNWIFYCFQMIALQVFSWRVGLYGDFINSTIYLFLGVSAYVIWGKGPTRRISISSTRMISLYLLGTTVLTGLLYCYLVSTKDPLPFMDAISTTTSLLATILMVFRKLDCWIIWLINDVLYCIEYYMLPNQATYLMMLNAVWCIMAFISLIKWVRDLTWTLE